MADSPLLDTEGPVQLAIKVDGKALADDVPVQSVRVQLAVNRIPDATVVLLCEAAQLPDDEVLGSSALKVGAEIEIAAFYGDEGEQTLFKGLIVSIRLRADSGKGVRLELNCRDKALKMTEVRSSVPYLDVKDSDVMTTIIKDAGLTADIEATTSETPLNLRVGATDWDFLRLMADRNGQVLMTADGKITSSAIDLSTAVVLTLTYGEDIVEMDIAVDAGRALGKAKASAWNAKDQKLASGEDSTFLTGIPSDTSQADIAKVLGTREHLSNTAREFPEAELTGFSKARMARASLATVHGSFKFQGSGKVNPGDMIELAGVGDRYGGNHFVSEVFHDIAGGVWSTTTRVGLPQDWTSDSFGLGAAGAEALTAPIYGVQVGKVKKLTEDPEGMQRIQVSLPMIGDPPADVWARHATPYATKDAGFHFLPEVGDEVLVAFLNADPNAPVIIGAVHSPDISRPDEPVEENYIKTIVTPTGMKLTFEEEKKVITLETPGAHKFTMDDDAKSVSLEDSNGNSIVMDGGGITMTSAADVSISATGDITAEATGDATIKGLNVTCEGQVGFTGKGGASAELSAGGTTDVKGAMVNIN
ncbi:MAG: type VI secretion system tip protein VgrG [Pseudomonadota bacterium]